jgi:hypothetical protein
MPSSKEYLAESINRRSEGIESRADGATDGPISL